LYLISLLITVKLNNAIYFLTVYNLTIVGYNQIKLLFSIAILPKFYINALTIIVRSNHP